MEDNSKTTGYKVSIRTLIVIIILFSTSFLPAKYFSPVIVFCGIVVLFFSRGIIQYGLIKFIFPLLIVFTTGILGAFKNEAFHVYRDISYALTPLALMITGYWLAENRKMHAGFFKILIIGGVFIASIHVAKFIMEPGLLGEVIARIRAKAINPNIDLVTIALILVIIRKKIGLKTYKMEYLTKYFLLPMLIVSFILSYSRTYLVVFIVMLAAVSGLIGRINLKVFLVFMISVITILVIIITAPKDDAVTFRGKIARSLRELKVKEYSNFRDINLNWRGYETKKAIETYNSGTLLKKMFGQGFGALVDLKMEMELAGEKFTKIPILHNGYAYILVKTGIAGIICYLLFYFLIISRAVSKPSNDKDKQTTIFRRLLLGTTLSLLLTMIVIGGMAEVHNSEFVLMTGFLLHLTERG